MPEHQIASPTPWGEIGCSLVVPTGTGPWTAVLLIAGSGPTDRDGNSSLVPARIDNLKLLAQGLADLGIASLRYDKRGVGASVFPGLSEAALRFDDLVADAVALGRMLQDDARFGALVLAGHSEGALIASLAAMALQPQAVVSIAGAGERASALMRRQIEVVLPADLAGQALAALAALEAGGRVDPVPEELVLLFRPSVQPYLASWFQHEPAELLAQLAMPVLLVHGSGDVQVPPGNADLLHAAQPQARLRMVPGMDHLLAVQGDVARGVAVVARDVGEWLQALATAAVSARGHQGPG